MFHNNYDDIISLQNLYRAWEEFVSGKKSKEDVAEFSLHLPDNISRLHAELKSQTYQHGRYEAFRINDPKPRQIHKASVRDRLLHHAIYRILYTLFDKKFIHDSYSCRDFKGTHRAIRRFSLFNRKISQRNTKTCFVLKCDIRKFFDSIDHGILLQILSKFIEDKNTLSLLENIIKSFDSGKSGKGLPLGNLTSQLLANIYMNEFDQFVKHKLKARYYVRYADDFVFMSSNRDYLNDILEKSGQFLSQNLKLVLHPDKVFIKTFSSGVDFLGWVSFPTHKVLRTVTKRRMFKNLADEPSEETITSYLGMLSHGNAHKLSEWARSKIKK